jgi:hypothetical protein
MDASAMIAIGLGLALGAATGVVFFGLLRLGVGLLLGGSAALALVLQLARFAALALGLYVAVRFGAVALLAAGAACLSARAAFTRNWGGAGRPAVRP